MELLIALAIGGGVGYLAYDQFTLWQKAEQAKGARCPACESKNVDGVTEDDLYDVKYLDDNFECRECSLKGEALDDEAEQLVGVIKRLDSLHSRWGQIWVKTAVWRFGGGHNDHDDLVDQDGRQHLDHIRSEMTSLWEDLAEMAREKPEIFSLEVNGNDTQTLEEYITEHWDPDEATRDTSAIPGIGTIDRLKRAREICKRFEPHLDTVRNTIADDLKQRQRCHW